ncbi:15889_t:CDS:2, partial [Racocetra persica]
PILVESITERLLLSPLPPNHPSTIANNSVSVISYSDSYPEGTVHHKKGATDELINPSNQSFKNFYNINNTALYDDSIQLLYSKNSSSMSQLQNLNFDVIYVTGWDDNYHPRQLLPNDNNTDANGIKHGKGWQSKRRCTYPQEIILRVTDGTARVRKLQILSHHYKIASKLEIYIGSIQQKVSSNTSDSDSIDEKRAFSWDKLPKIIDTDGINSVGIVAITVMGEPVDYLLAGESQKIPIEHVDEGVSRVASPETCIIPGVHDDSMTIDSSQH